MSCQLSAHIFVLHLYSVEVYMGDCIPFSYILV